MPAFTDRWATRTFTKTRWSAQPLVLGRHERAFCSREKSLGWLIWEGNARRVEAFLASAPRCIQRTPERGQQATSMTCPCVPLHLPCYRASLFNRAAGHKFPPLTPGRAFPDVATQPYSRGRARWRPWAAAPLGLSQKKPAVLARLLCHQSSADALPP